MDLKPPVLIHPRATVMGNVGGHDAVKSVTRYGSGVTICVQDKSLSVLIQNVPWTSDKMVSNLDDIFQGVKVFDTNFLQFEVGYRVEIST